MYDLACEEYDIIPFCYVKGRDDQGEQVAKWLATVRWVNCTQALWTEVRELHHQGQDERALALIMEHTLSK